jgi:uncharacterized protein YdaU (DUF1376 family)
MYYYAFHIGDYASHTGHLELLEDLAYRRLLDFYYMQNGPLKGCAADLARFIRMREHVEIVDRVLNEFFERSDDDDGISWSNKRCDTEIEAHQRQIAGGKLGATRRWNMAKRGEIMGNPSLTDSSPMGTPTTPQWQPITNNQEPVSISSLRSEIDSASASSKKVSRRSKIGRPADVDESVWESFLQLRKAKRAPLSEVAVAGIGREAVKAGVTLQQALEIACTRGWTSFKADWIADKKLPAIDQAARYSAIFGSSKPKTFFDVDMEDANESPRLR